MSSQIHLLTVLRATIRMMGIRGYNVDQYEFLERIDAKSFDTVYGHPPQAYINSPLLRAIITDDKFSMRTMMSTILFNDEGHSCLIFFAPLEGKEGKKASIDSPRYFLTLMDKIVLNPEEVQANVMAVKKKCTTGIIITHTVLTPKGNSTIKEFHEKMKIQHYTDEDVQLDPSIHIYTPYAEVLTQLAKTNFFSTNQIDPTKMPRDMSDEALAKFLGAMPNDVIEYERVSFLPNVLVDEEIFFRMVKRPIEKKKAEKKRTT